MCPIVEEDPLTFVPPPSPERVKSVFVLSSFFWLSFLRERERERVRGGKKKWLNGDTQQHRVFPSFLRRRSSLSSHFFSCLLFSLTSSIPPLLRFSFFIYFLVFSLSLSLSLSLYPPFPNLFFESNQSLHVRLHDNVSHRDSTAGVDPPQNHLPMDHHRARFYLLASYFQFARCSEI